MKGSSSGHRCLAQSEGQPPKVLDRESIMSDVYVCLSIGRSFLMVVESIIEIAPGRYVFIRSNVWKTICPSTEPLVWTYVEMKATRCCCKNLRSIPYLQFDPTAIVGCCRVPNRCMIILTASETPHNTETKPPSRAWLLRSKMLNWRLPQPLP